MSFNPNEVDKLLRDIDRRLRTELEDRLMAAAAAGDVDAASDAARALVNRGWLEHDTLVRAAAVAGARAWASGGSIVVPAGSLGDRAMKAAGHLPAQSPPAAIALRSSTWQRALAATASLIGWIRAQPARIAAIFGRLRGR